MTKYYYPTDKIPATRLFPFDLYHITTTDGKKIPLAKNQPSKKRNSFKEQLGFKLFYLQLHFKRQRKMKVYS